MVATWSGYPEVGDYRTPRVPSSARDDLICYVCGHDVMIHDYIITWSVMTIRLIVDEAYLSDAPRPGYLSDAPRP
eukprot:5939743-Amphidinium_carterae.1